VAVQGASGNAPQASSSIVIPKAFRSGSRTGAEKSNCRKGRDGVTIVTVYLGDR